MNGMLTIPKVKNDTLNSSNEEFVRRQGTLPMTNQSVRQGTLPNLNGEPSTRSARQDIVKAHIIQQIDNLKTDIQNLLDKKNLIYMTKTFDTIFLIKNSIHSFLFFH